MWSCFHAQIVAATLLLFFCGSSAQRQPLSKECSTTDNFCAVQNSTLVIATPANGTVLTTQENRISATEYDTTKDYVSFLVLYDEGSCAASATTDSTCTVEFEWGAKIMGPNDPGSWCTGLPQEFPFAGERCTSGAVKLAKLAADNQTKFGGLSAYLVTVSVDYQKKDLGLLRDPDVAICFRMTSETKVPLPWPKRCVYLRPIPAQTPRVFVDGFLVNADKVLTAYMGNRMDIPGSKQGYDLKLEVRVMSYSASLPVVIEYNVLGKDSFAELPGADWTGPTTCMATGLPYGPCWEWNRTIVYRPTSELLKKKMMVSFQTTTTLPNQYVIPDLKNSLKTTISTNDVMYLGVACIDKGGRCPVTASGVPGFLLTKIAVRVEHLTPRFRWNKNNHTLILNKARGKLYRDMVNLADPPLHAGPVMKCSDPTQGELETLPASCILDPHPAYTNCQMKSFSFVADVQCVPTDAEAALPPALCSNENVQKMTTELTFVLVSAKSTSGSRDALKMGMRMSERLFIREPSVAVQDNSIAAGEGDFKNLGHTAISWTPPVEAMGFIFNVCVEARTPHAMVARCIPVEVKRCFYCTVETDTLHSIAAKFQTFWMQIWSANYERMSQELGIDPIGTTSWNHTKNPNSIEPGTLIRLGPVFNTNARTQVSWLINEFRTSHESMMLVNPNMSPDATHIEAYELVCILPDICSQDGEN